MRISECTVALWVFFCTAAPVDAHHSNLASSTTERTTVQGTITKVEWVNPHVQIYLDVKDSGSGNVAQWRIETESVTNLKAKGVTLENLKIGTLITVKGVERTGHRPRIMEVPEPDASWKN